MQKPRLTNVKWQWSLTIDKLNRKIDQLEHNWPFGDTYENHYFNVEQIIFFIKNKFPHKFEVETPIYPVQSFNSIIVTTHTLTITSQVLTIMLGWRHSIWYQVTIVQCSVVWSRIITTVKRWKKVFDVHTRTHTHI